MYGLCRAARQPTERCCSRPIRSEPIVFCRLSKCPPSQAYTAGTPGNEFWIIHVYGSAYEVHVLGCICRWCFESMTLSLSCCGCRWASPRARFCARKLTLSLQLHGHTWSSRCEGLSQYSSLHSRLVPFSWAVVRRLRRTCPLNSRRGLLKMLQTLGWMWRLT